jgi:glycolate oxidase iron-sulfur subunit
MKSFEALMAEQTPKLLNCVHCGLCLDECPTYRFSGDEANSPRGRLGLWRAIAEGRLEADAVTDHYTDECVGCLACVTACPANVPYGDLLLEARSQRQAAGAPLDWRLKVLAPWLNRGAALKVLALPLRLLRRLGLPLPWGIFPGSVALWESSASYAKRVNQALAPSKGTVALLQGCIMEAAFKEINFATIRVLAANGYRVLVPEAQGCCGAVHEHAGLHGKAELDAQNQRAFAEAQVVISNSSGCGLSLSHALPGKQRDLLDYLEKEGVRPGAKLDYSHVYYDFPCHAYHGLGLQDPPQRLFEAAGLDWSLAPDADRCCGSGGAYQMTHPGNAAKILKEKSAFLDQSPYENPVLATGNHVCLMQWNQARTARPFQARHLVQLLDESYRKAAYYPENI